MEKKRQDRRKASRNALPQVRVSAEGTLCDDGRIRPVWACESPRMRDYYDTEWGVPVRDERGLFERLVLESFQSGLSWRTVLMKRPAFRVCFHDFEPDAVAAMTADDVTALLDEPKIIRNRRKIEAAIHNAHRTIALRDEGGLPALIWSFQPDRTPMPRTLSEIPTQSEESIALTKALKRKGFKHVGPTSMFALMEAIGMVDTHLLASHRRGSSGLFDAHGVRTT